MPLLNLFRDDAPEYAKRIIADMAVVLETTRRMWMLATNNLLFNDPLTEDLDQTDEFVDEKEREIRRLIREHALRNPDQTVARSLTILSIVQDGERIGDLAKTIGSLSGMAHHPLLGPETAALRETSERITRMFDGAYDGFIKRDPESAHWVMEENELVKESLREFQRKLADSDGLSVNAAVILAIGSVMMGRVSSHLSNIVSTVVLPFEQIRGPAPAADTDAE